MKAILPLVSCIMPTNNRRTFVLYAINYFLQQDYPNKELLIVDDGTDSIEDIVPVHEQIRYIRLLNKMTLGEKRNYCIRQSKADLIMHWDDDDWMASYRISYQVQELLKHNAEVCGLQQMLFRELATGKCWLYQYPPQAQPWLAGGSLLYTRDFWQKSPFPDMQIASDTRFIFAHELTSFVALSDYRFYVASIHGKNTSPKNARNSLWHPVQSSIVDSIMSKVNLYHQAYDLTDNRCLNEVGDFKKRIAILITTCNRAALLNKVIDELKQEQGSYNLEFFIIDDGVAGNGKKLYWKTINSLWEQIRNKSFDYYIQLPDDLELNKNFIYKSIAAWEKIEDTKKICLNLFFDGHRVGKTCWTNFWPQLKSYNGTRYLRTQWMDMTYICERKFFEELGYSLYPVHPSRWLYNPQLSSGVGQQISTRLHNSGWHLYQITENEAEHIGDASIMNPEIRNKEPMKAAKLPFVYAGIASIPEREEQLKNAIASIIPYIDHLFVFLNNYTQLPSWLLPFKNVTSFLSTKENSNKGDAGKFFGLNKINTSDFYYFTIDDDMVYPKDYTWKMINKIECFNRKAVVGCGGYIMKSVVNHFYNDRAYSWHISQPNAADRSVHILHTCLTAWHSSTIQFGYEYCMRPNMGDIWLALAAQAQKVPMILIERPADWVKVQAIHPAKTIFGKYKNDCSEQTAIYNSWHNWKVITAGKEESEYLHQRPHLPLVLK